MPISARLGSGTVGWGHTAQAGPPAVVPGMRMPREDADQILIADLHQFQQAVWDGLNAKARAKLNPNQLSALYSFCYNVGPANWMKSSVRQRCNALRISEVPGRMMLWNKAGGRALLGLVRRRAAEGALFVAPWSEPLAGDEAAVEITEPAGRDVGPIEQVTGKPLWQSRNIYSNLIKSAVGNLSIFFAFAERQPWLAAALILAFTSLTIFLFWDRLSKSKFEGV